MLINIFNISKEEKTKYIAEKISNICKKGDVIALSGRLGIGKTTFAKHFIRKVSKVDQVPSPSYNLLLSYKTNNTMIHHMDAWRLKNIEEAISLGITEMYENSIFIIEWAEKIKKILPSDCLRLQLFEEKSIKKISVEGNSNWKKRLEPFFLNDK